MVYREIQEESGVRKGGLLAKIEPSRRSRRSLRLSDAKRVFHKSFVAKEMARFLCAMKQLLLVALYIQFRV